MNLFAGFETPLDLPWTMSFLIRKRMQVDGLNEMSKEKRPTDHLIWEGSSEELEDWIDAAYDVKETRRHDEIPFVIREDDIEE
jgi:hypothetical protein